MKALFFALTVLTLAACASVPSSSPTSRSQGWSAYRAQMMQQRDRGALTPVAAEEKIAAKYREIYGPDPMMEGVFAYGKRLYVMADAGRLSIDEADALANARMDEVLARDAAQVQYHEWLTNRFPPNGGD
jgi:hypothetical protein